MCLQALLSIGGDIIAQLLDHYQEEHSHKDGTKEPNKKKSFALDWRRLGIFFVFGTVISGPAYHYWFNQLNELPLRLWNLKNVRHRGKILTAYTYLRAHGIEVKLDLAKLPNAKELGKVTAKVAKIAADQLLFSSLYTVVLFMSFGMLNGAIDKYNLESSGKYIDEVPELFNKYKKDSAKVFCDILEIKGELAKRIASPPASVAEGGHLRDEQALIDLIMRLKLHQLDSCRNLLWSDIMDRSWEKTKSVFWGVYAADCTVWPFLQLINFTFVPLRFQVLYVNACTLVWNTCISFVENSNFDVLSFLKGPKEP